ncbi:hypothetical protein RI129_001078 [Pyrocoelia pectoralis]|uniref:Uncharacterized protein n=1 Tax=Pyrocoelia pectoralis TaxID=417401 RepID=A0AAN7VT91_9COLE
MKVTLALYVVSSAEYKNKDKREAAYKKLNKIKSSKTSGTGTDNIYTPKLWYFPLLQFLSEKSYPVRSSASTLDITNDHVGSIYINIHIYYILCRYITITLYTFSMLLGN